jgi:hypothetical protein
MKILKWVGIIFIGLIVLGIMFGDDDSKTKQTTPTSSANQEKEQSAAKPAEEKQTTTPAKPTPEKPPEKKLNVTTMAITKDNLKEVLKDVIPSDKFVKVDVSKEKSKCTVDIYFNPGDVWDEKALVKQSAITATDSYEVLFKNPKIDKVWFWTQTKMTDAKGNSSIDNVVNISLTKENAKGINWPEFKDMVLLDYNALFRIVDSYYIHPGVLKNLK